MRGKTRRLVVSAAGVAVGIALGAAAPIPSGAAAGVGAARPGDGTGVWTWGARGSGQLGDGAGWARPRPVRVPGGPWRAVSAGERHSLGVTTAGALWAWGAGDSGRLGAGRATRADRPVPIAGSWRAVDAGARHSVGIRSDGSLWTWGANEAGQLGDGTTTPRRRPVRGGPTGWRWRSVVAGGAHTVAIRADGSLWAWGANLAGQLGDGSTVDRSRPVRVGPAGWRWKSVAAGAEHTLAVRADGTLWSWGDDRAGQLGRPGTGAALRQPGRVGQARWASVTAGAFHSVGVRADRTLWAWGDNTTGQLGAAAPAHGAARPVRLNAASGWVEAAAGDRHSLARRRDGSVWGWGDNGAGALGRGPARVTSVRRLEGRRVTALAAGAQHSLAVDADGRAWAWGLNRDGQLGDGGSRVPAPRRSVPGRWGTVTAGAAHTLAIRTDGTLWAWGANDTGQLGDTTTTDRTRPVRIGDPTWRWRTVTAGAAHTLAIRTDGTLWAWGANDWGQVGITGPETAPAPTRIGDPTWRWRTVTAGAAHTLAIRTDGTLWAWGANDTGQLGDTTTTDRTRPVRIGDPTWRWRTVTAGAAHTLAIRTDGTLWAWGANDWGQVGITGPETAAAPRRIGGGTWIGVAAGDMHSVALRR